MIIDSKGKLFEERRKNEFNTKEEKRAKTDRRNPKNAYKPEE